MRVVSRWLLNGSSQSLLTQMAWNPVILFGGKNIFFAEDGCDLASYSARSFSILECVVLVPMGAVAESLSKDSWLLMQGKIIPFNLLQKIICTGCNFVV